MQQQEVLFGHSGLRLAAPQAGAHPVRLDGVTALLDLVNATPKLPLGAALSERDHAAWS